MTWTPVGTGAADRAAAATRALGRAEEAVGEAVGHLVRASDVDWWGGGSAGYHEELATTLAAVRLLHRRLGEATGVATEHAAVVREREALDIADPAAGVVPGVAVLALDRPRRWCTVP